MLEKAGWKCAQTRGGIKPSEFAGSERVDPGIQIQAPSPWARKQPAKKPRSRRSSGGRPTLLELAIVNFLEMKKNSLLITGGALYKSASERMKSQTGFGLTADEYRKGFTTLEEWCKEKCPYYGRLDALFGESLNISETAAPIDVLANVTQTGGSSDLRDLGPEVPGSDTQEDDDDEIEGGCM
ncbi:hypothetical protein BDK51DRAFT_40151 [Blyttiomyces helicus]|uniref:Uncharacterized protein n=1 Tax=Blyttiomyces helicus TaxID=388810 RepID=A0A4P9WLT0_9FUNG|nr:hypothetical protein BDK51DRAFT_40151 [Blyttiomyces helicus]|eukprot:RKO93999.1 hypothetical protein BDK51DRAFT_40151 [Blyttiomyces helicus]